MFGPVMHETEQSLKLTMSQETPPMVIFEFPWRVPNPVPWSVRYVPPAPGPKLGSMLYTTGVNAAEYEKESLLQTLQVIDEPTTRA